MCLYSFSLAFPGIRTRFDRNPWKSESANRKENDSKSKLYFLTVTLLMYRAEKLHVLDHFTTQGRILCLLPLRPTVASAGWSHSSPYPQRMCTGVTAFCCMTDCPVPVLCCWARQGLGGSRWWGRILLPCNVFSCQMCSLKDLLRVGSSVTLLSPCRVFHFSSTEGKCWILMKRTMINTTVRLSAKQAWEKATCYQAECKIWKCLRFFTFFFIKRPTNELVL